MLVKLEISPGAQHVLQAKITCAGELVAKGTLDYCISLCDSAGYRIENAHDALIYLQKNATFVGYVA